LDGRKTIFNGRYRSSTFSNDICDDYEDYDDYYDYDHGYDY